jgi:hypothetical protein
LGGRLKSTLVGAVGCTSWLYSETPETAAAVLLEDELEQEAGGDLIYARRDQLALSCATVLPGLNRKCLTVPNPTYVVSSRVPPVPLMSSRTQFRSLSFPRVSSRVLLVPRMRDTSVTRIGRRQEVCRGRVSSSEA